MEIVIDSLNDLDKVADAVLESLNGRNVVAFFAPMGAGKTTLISAIMERMGSQDTVTSPTFALVNEYHGKYDIYHFDMYRVQSWDDLYSTGFFDYIDNGVLVIEWSENIEGALPEETLRITISRGNHDNQRIFEIEGVDSL